MDLADLSSHSKHNDKFKYLLNIIDLFSRYAWSVPLKDKAGTSIAIALKFLFRDRKTIIQSDKCTELVNSTVQQYLKPQGVSIHTTHNPDIKGAIIERFKMTLKTKMYKYSTKSNIPLLRCHKLLANYNNSIHSTIGIPPSKVKPSYIYSVWKKMNSLG